MHTWKLSQAKNYRKSCEEESVRSFDKEEFALASSKEESVRSFDKEESVLSFGKEESVWSSSKEESVRSLFALELERTVSCGW